MLWFSYKTLVAFEYDGQKYISENLWGNTTGRHINLINRDHKIRLLREDFENRFRNLMQVLQL